jgi:hypothetical protein
MKIAQEPKAISQKTLTKSSQETFTKSLLSPTISQLSL